MNETNDILVRIENKLKRIESNTAYVKWFIICFLLATTILIIQGWVVKLFR